MFIQFDILSGFLRADMNLTLKYVKILSEVKSLSAIGIPVSLSMDDMHSSFIQPLCHWSS